MPWQRVRKDYDHHRDHLRRITYRLDLSIIVALAVLLATLMVVLFPIFDNFDPAPSHGSGYVDWRLGPSRPAGLSSTQEICGAAALLCAAYLAVALFLRSKSRI